MLIFDDADLDKTILMASLGGCLALCSSFGAPLFADDGAVAYRQLCAACHDAGIDRAPNREALQAMSAERVLSALESGAMISMASRRTGSRTPRDRAVRHGQTALEERRRARRRRRKRCVARGGRRCQPAGADRSGTAGATTRRNTRFQDGAAAGLTAADVPRLKVKWAFGFPGDLDANAQPTIVGGRVFVGSQGGKVYSLERRHGLHPLVLPGRRRGARGRQRRPVSTPAPDR